MNKQEITRLRERGSILVLFAGLIIVLTGFAVLAVDIGRIYIVRNELQNVADAAALAGANCLDRQSLAGSLTDCSATKATTLNWARASAKAVDQLGQNSADNIAVATTGSGYQIDVGYWNVQSNGPSGGSFSTTFSPLTKFDKPAVKVTVTKDAGKNGGPVTMLTAAMFGGSHVPMSANAVAVLSSPSKVPPGSVIPYVINKCMYDKYWNAATGTPVIYTGSPPDTNKLSTVGQPWELLIGSSYHYGACDSGQWTSFNLDVNSQSAVANLIASGNPTSLGIGDMTWIEPGSKTASFNDLRAKYPAGGDVTLLVVDTASLASKGEAPIVAFAGFHITDVQGGSKKYVQGHFLTNYITPGAGGIGPFYGTYTPPRLAH
ncbi:MAG TPA: pilus assembly protein TadG-related protein [Noviherbaspirillum sp.]